MTQTHVDANNFVSAAPMSTRNNSDPATSLGRRTSIIEPIGNNTYESSVQTGYLDQRSSYAAYEQAASGVSRPASRFSARQSEYGQGLTSMEDGADQYHGAHAR
jgi:hypothetical protein